MYCLMYLAPLFSQWFCLVCLAPPLAYVSMHDVLGVILENLKQHCLGSQREIQEYMSFCKVLHPRTDRYDQIVQNISGATPGGYTDAL